MSTEIKIKEPCKFGTLVRVVGVTLEARGLEAPLGAICEIVGDKNTNKVEAEVVGFQDQVLFLMPFTEPTGINPGATVPVLLNKGRPIYESHEQIKFIFNSKENLNTLEDRDVKSIDYWTDKASMVGNPVKGHKKYAGNTIGPLTFPLFTTMLKNVSILEVMKGLISHPMKQRVLIFLLLKIFGFTFIKLPPIQNLIQSAFEELNKHLCELETELSSSKKEWLASDNFSLADISWSVILHRLDECGWDGLLLEKKPFINAYYEKIKQRDSFIKGIVDQNNPNLEKGIKDLKLAIQNNQFLKSFHEELSTLN